MEDVSSRNVMAQRRYKTNTFPLAEQTSPRCIPADMYDMGVSPDLESPSRSISPDEETSFGIFQEGHLAPLVSHNLVFGDLSVCRDVLEVEPLRSSEMVDCGQVQAACDDEKEPSTCRSSCLMLSGTILLVIGLLAAVVSISALSVENRKLGDYHYSSLTLPPQIADVTLPPQFPQAIEGMLKQHVSEQPDKVLAHRPPKEKEVERSIASSQVEPRTQEAAVTLAPVVTSTTSSTTRTETARSEFCSLAAQAPNVTVRTWEIPEEWADACKDTNVKKRYPSSERNWCWVGLKDMCHWNLKKHKSWSTFQDMAAEDGLTPPASQFPFHPIARHDLCDTPAHGSVRSWSSEELRTAREWFKTNVAVYVLSLPTEHDERWHMIKDRLDELEIWATRVPGVDMREPDALENAKKHGFVPASFNFTRAQENGYSKEQSMGSMLGTVGCAAAHFKAQMNAVADGSALAIIMEDDSWPTDDFIPRVWSLVRDEMPCDWEVTALLSRCGYGECVSPHLMRVMPDTNEPVWRCHQGSNWGMHAVLYRVEAIPELQEKWKPVVFDEERPHCMDVDVALASISDKVGFYAVPAVQDPGFVKESNHRSARWDINFAARTTSTRTTTSPFFIPTMKPGEPWPGAWDYG